MNLTNKTAIIKFWAPWCQPCKAVAPIVSGLAIRLGIELIDVNIDEDYETAVAFGVRSIPMVVGIKAGVAVDSLVGTHPEAKYAELLAKLKLE